MTAPVAPSAARKRLGRAIRAMRIIRGLSQADLARGLNVTPSYVCGIEKGALSLGHQGRGRFARALGIRRSSLDNEFGVCLHCGGTGMSKGAAR